MSGEKVSTEQAFAYFLESIEAQRCSLVDPISAQPQQNNVNAFERVELFSVDLCPVGQGYLISSEELSAITFLKAAHNIQAYFKYFFLNPIEVNQNSGSRLQSLWSGALAFGNRVSKGKAIADHRLELRNKLTDNIDALIQSIGEMPLHPTSLAVIQSFIVLLNALLINWEGFSIEIKVGLGEPGKAGLEFMQLYSCLLVKAHTVAVDIETIEKQSFSATCDLTSIQNSLLKLETLEKSLKEDDASQAYDSQINALFEKAKPAGFVKENHVTSLKGILNAKQEKLSAVHASLIEKEKTLNQPAQVSNSVSTDVKPLPAKPKVAVLKLSRQELLAIGQKELQKRKLKKQAVLDPLSLSETPANTTVTEGQQASANLSEAPPVAEASNAQPESDPSSNNTGAPTPTTSTDTPPVTDQIVVDSSSPSETPTNTTVTEIQQEPANLPEVPPVDERGADLDQAPNTNDTPATSSTSPWWEPIKAQFLRFFRFIASFFGGESTVSDLSSVEDTTPRLEVNVVVNKEREEPSVFGPLFRQATELADRVATLFRSCSPL